MDETWKCPNCGFLDGRNVTFQETCEFCGSDVSLSGTVPGLEVEIRRLTKELAVLREKLEHSELNWLNALEEVKDLRKKLEGIRIELKNIEWVDSAGYYNPATGRCLKCHCDSNYGHAPHCAIAMLVAALKEG